MDGFLGIVCSILLLTALRKKSHETIVWWIVYKGLLIIPQIIVSFIIDDLFWVYFPPGSIAIIVIFLLYFILQVYFTYFIINLYQNTLIALQMTAKPVLSFLTPQTLEGLLDNEVMSGDSTPVPIIHSNEHFANVWVVSHNGVFIMIHKWTKDNLDHK